MVPNKPLWKNKIGLKVCRKCMSRNGDTSWKKGSEDKEEEEEEERKYLFKLEFPPFSYP